MEPQIQSALIQAGATVISAALAAFIVMHQIGKQKEQSREALETGERLKLHLDVYRELLHILDEFTELNSRLTAKLNLIQYGFASVWFNPELRKQYTPESPIEPLDLIELMGQVGHKAADAIIMVENWRVIDTRMGIFQMALNAAMFDYREGTDRLGGLVGPLLVTLEIDGKRIHPAIDHLNQEAINKVLDAAIEGSGTVECVMHDFRVELQNALVGELFGNNCPVRVPIDPKYPVITLANHEQLEHHFINNTAWGIEQQAINTRVRERVEAQAK